MGVAETMVTRGNAAASEYETTTRSRIVRAGHESSEE